MNFPLKYLAAAMGMLPVLALSQVVTTLGAVVVTGERITNQPLGSATVDDARLSSQRSSSSDTTRLLQDIPGLSIYSAGGVSGLPAIHGMADDRLRIQVDGMDLIAACPNHMNSALSYIDPSKVGSISVFAGITPVSVGGDSIGGTIQVKSAPPEFADSAENSRAQGNGAAFYRSNGQARGYNLSASYIGQDINLSASAASVDAANYSAGGDFKLPGPGAVGGAWLAGNEVGSSAYTSKNQDIGLAWRHDKHLLQLNVGTQHLPFEGFPNQRMDMTGNDSTQVNLRYNGQFAWGSLEARAYGQDTEHFMNMGPDRFAYGTLGMPMNTKAETRGAMAQGEMAVSDNASVRFGAEYQSYTLYDWWPAAGGVMGPRTYWNVDYGQRERSAVYAEWEALWGEQWLTQLGARSEYVRTDAGPVQGYNAQAIWASDAALFNAQARQRADTNFDFSALTRYTPGPTQTFEAGFARKSRSPNLYQRYAWSTQPMAALMNNFVGDGNGYIGNLNLKPEVAHTLSASADWHSAQAQHWGFKATAYITQVQDFIDAQRCDVGQCGGAANLVAANGFVNLQYVNSAARFYGLDLSGNWLMAKSGDYGSFKASGLLSYVRGENQSTGDGLYNIMPLNAKLAVVQSKGAWSHSAEVQLVGAKTRLSQVRNEVATAGYGLLNWRSSFEWKQARLDFAIENLLDRSYALPLGGAYAGQGASMTSGGIPWGVVVPGMGRSINLALNLRF